MRWAFLSNPKAFVKPVESFSSKVVLLAAKEYNREDYDGEEVRDGGKGMKPVNKITCENNEVRDRRNSTEKSEDEIGSSDLEKMSRLLGHPDQCQQLEERWLSVCRGIKSLKS